MATRGYVRSSKTKQRIYDIAMRLFSEKGYHAVTLSNIAEAADISTGTLYRYYPFKGDFLMEVGRESVERLRVFAQNLPEGLDVFNAVLAVMLEDVRGTHSIFSAPDEEDPTVPSPTANDLRLAYSHEIYASREHLDTEIATRSELVSIYAEIIEGAKERGTFATKFDSRVFAQVIVAIYFQEFDKGIYRADYPYEAKFREKLAVLFEGRMHDETNEG